jgi:hypothetical protein
MKLLSKLRFLIFVTRRDLGNEDHEKNPKIESWEIQKSKLSHELLGDEPFKTSILRFLKLKKMFTGQALSLTRPMYSTITRARVLVPVEEHFVAGTSTAYLRVLCSTSTPYIVF